MVWQGGAREDSPYADSLYIVWVEFFLPYPKVIDSITGFTVSLHVSSPFPVSVQDKTERHSHVTESGINFRHGHVL